MFFDNKPKKDDVYTQMLIDIAVKQSQLLNHCAIMERKEPNAPLLYRLMQNRQNKQRHAQLMTELSTLRKAAEAHRQEAGYSGGMFWWNVPWDSLENYLTYDTIKNEERGAWRFQRDWVVKQLKGNVYWLLLSEQGHFTSVSGTRYYDEGIRSEYSVSEIKNKVRDFNREQNDWALLDIATSDNRPVHSYLTGQDYNSTADYYLSSEYMMRREYRQEQYERTLYTKVESETLELSTQSLHYNALFETALFETDADGRLIRLSILNYKPASISKSAPAEVASAYAAKDAAVGCAAFLAKNAGIKSVPLELFGQNIEKEAGSYEDALRQAEIFTVLAKKIVK